MDELMVEDDMISGGYIEYRGQFSERSNKDKILDIFDAYCDIQELLIAEACPCSNSRWKHC